MKRMLKDWAAAILVGLVVYLAAAWVLTPETISGPAPAFALTRASGGTMTSEELRGKVTVLNFWGSWCPPCRAEIPDFADYAKDHPDVQLVGIAVRSGKGSALQRAADSLGITWPVVESSPEVLQAYGVSAYPTTVVVNEAGDVVHVHIGAMDKDDLADAVRKAR